MESSVKILQTSDYDQFKTQDGNRPLLKNDLIKIEKKILDNNLLRYHPILVSKEFEIIDGQHRLEVARRNSLTISFIVMTEDSSLRTTQSVNTTGKPWTVRDFLNSYIALNQQEYIKFNEYLERYKFLTVGQLIDLGSVRRASAQKTECFRDGDLEMRGCEFLTGTLNNIHLYICCSIPLSSSTHFQRFMFMAAKRNIVFDHQRMIKRIEDNIDIVKRIPADAYIVADVLGEIYNYKLRSANNINFNLRGIK